MSKKRTKNKLFLKRVAEYEKCLLLEYGVVVGGKNLRHLLGYRTGDAFRQAVRRNQIPFPTFIPEGRRARMARTRDIAIWLASIDTESKNYKSGKQGGVNMT